MKTIKTGSRPKAWFAPLLLTLLIAGCGGKDPILGTGGATMLPPIVPPPPVVTVIVPGAPCTAASGVTIPTATASNPTDGDLSVMTSTGGVLNNGKLLTVNFSLPMAPATITAPATFTLKETVSGTFVTAAVALDLAGTTATMTTAAALQPGMSYTADISTAATSAAIPAVAIACAYEWKFTTITPAAIGAPPVNLGKAAPFGIAATAGITNTTTVPVSHINGDVVLDPNATCNAVTIDGAGGFGLCGSNASTPTLTGIVISPLYPDAGITSGAIKADLLAAFLSITPPAGPPAAGSLSGATSIPAGTTLGEPTGAALVQGDNLFAPGVYQSNTSILITGDLTLDGQGDTNAVFIFQSSSTVGAAAGAMAPGPHTRILLINGAKASNVWWQAGTSATLGTAAEWNGNILAAANITMETGAVSCGRLLAGAFTAGAFVLDSNVVSVPGNSNAPSSCK
ncbi:MAG: ice-binding family protein [bacterium]|nr:ice-binding family protein [bacterium]